jgi:hypothetical protein
LIYACMANDARFNCGLTHSNLFHWGKMCVRNWAEPLNKTVSMYLLR